MVTYDHSFTTTKQNKGGNSSAVPRISVLCSSFMHHSNMLIKFKPLSFSLGLDLPYNS